MTTRYENLSELYQAARSDEEPTRADLRAVRTAMMSAGIAAVTFKASAASGKLLALTHGGAKLFTLGQLVTYSAIGVAIGGGIATAGFVAERHSMTRPAVSAPAPVRPPTAKREAVARAPTSAESAQVPRDEAAATNTVDMPETAVPSRSNHELRTAPVASTQPPESSPPAVPSAAERAGTSQAQSLTDETRGLAEVQVALSTGNVPRALHLLDEQDRAFPGGSLAQERAAARAIALCTARRGDAGLVKQRFIAAYPGSPLVRRVTAACKNR